MRLTKLEVTFERTKQIQQYEPAKASVTLGFTVEDDEVDRGSGYEVAGDALARAKLAVAEALGLKTPNSGSELIAKNMLAAYKPEAEAVRDGLNVPNPSAANSLAATAEAVKTEVNPTAGLKIAPIPMDTVPTAAESAPFSPNTEPKKRGRPKKNSDPASMEDDTNAAQSGTSAMTILTSQVTDPAAMFEEIVAPIEALGNYPTYTVADLNKAVQQKMTEMSKAKVPDAGKKIMEYLASWKPDPNVIMTGNQIQQSVPEDKRVEFIEKLKTVGV